MSDYTVVTLDKVNSTNAYALGFMASLEDKTVITALNQTEGRGRYNRKWIGDNSSNLYMTIVLKPESSVNYPYSNLTQYLSVVVCKILEKDFNIKADIKWPNDVLVNGCKIAGILAETSVKDNQISGIALGLGLNINLKRETIDKIDQKAVSMAVLKGCEFKTEEVLKRICDCFFADYDRFIKNGFEFIKDEYVKKCGFLGENITIREENKQYKAVDIDDEGLLLVKDDLDRVKKIITGDVLCAYVRKS